MKNKIFVAFLFITVIISCKTPRKDDIVLQIGKYQLTGTELEEKRKAARYRLLSDQALQKKLIEDGRIVAFALDHRYDTISVLNKLVDYASRAHATGNDGFAWNNKVKSTLQVTEKDLKKAYLVRSHVYSLEIIQYPSSISEQCKSKVKDFNLIKQRLSGSENVKVFNTTLRFPYYPLSIYIGMDAINTGQVIGPVETEDGYIIAHVTGIRQINQSSYEQERNGIKQELLSGLTQKQTWEMQKHTLAAAKFEMDYSAIKELTAKFNAREKNWPGLDPTLVLLTYNSGKKQVRYTVSDFKEFVNNEPVFLGSLSAPEDVKKMLRSFITAQCLFAEAKQMNIQTDKKYLQFANDYREKIFIEHYKRNYIYPKVSIQPKEVEDYYREHNGTFSAFESATVSVCKFRNIREAYQHRALLLKTGRNSAEPEKNISLDNGTKLPICTTTEIKISDQNDPKLIRAILTLHPGQLSVPIEFKDEYCLISVISKKGLTTLPFIYAKENIIQALRSRKEKQLNEQLLAGLQAVYPVETNKLAQYLSIANKVDSHF